MCVGAQVCEIVYTVFPHESVLTFKMFKMEKEVSDLSVFHTEQFFFPEFSQQR